MIPRWVPFALVVSMLLLSTAVVRWRRPLARTPALIVRPAHRVDVERASFDDSIVESAKLIADNDPFRLSNSPANVRYVIGAENQPPNASTTPVRWPRPVFVLKAIVGGPPWRAVIDGIPGARDATIAGAGDRFDAFVVKSVTATAVTIQSPDTSWVLSFPRSP